MIDLRAYTDTLNGKSLAVFGLGKSGLSTVKALIKSGAHVYAWDENQEAREKAKALGAEVKTLNRTTLKKCAALVLSPGVPLHYPEPHEVVQAARDAGCDITGDIELFYSAGKERTIMALTGTNGKSTSVTLAQHVLQACKRKSVLGGNIGAPILDAKLPPKKDGAVVLELSSYQLDLCEEFEADIAVLLNITPDHIDRHGSMAGYVAAKERIFRGNSTAIICVDDEYTKSIYQKLSAQEGRKVIPVSIIEELEQGVFVRDGKLYEVDRSGIAQERFSLNGITHLNGLHNHQNAAAIYAAMRELGLKPDEIFDALKSYPGLTHRQYLARTINGVAYINDSKATNAEAVSKALTGYKNVYWIVGGRAKEGGLEGLGKYIDGVKHAFLIGETMEEFGLWMRQHGIPYENSHTLDIAVEQAHYMAQKSRGQPGASGTVMLSPACASFDQFPSFEARGDYFVGLVEALSEEIDDT